MRRNVYLLPKAGSISYMNLEEVDLEDPGDEEVTIAVRAIGLNFADIFSMHGIYSATPEGSFIPGLEYAGVVLKKGKNVIGCREGDQVMGLTRFGAYASHVNVNHNYILPLPEEWSYEEGASFLVTGLTAYYALVNLGGLQKKQTVLIHSAAGGVGIMANRIAKAFDAYTIGTIGTAAKIPLLEQEGYDTHIVRDQNFKQNLENLLEGRPLHLALECIGGQIFKDTFTCLSPMGRMVIYGAAQYASSTNRPNYLKLVYRYVTRPRIDPQAMISENKSLMAFNLIWLYKEVELMHEIVDELFQLDLDPPLVGHRFDFQQLPEAVKTFQQGKTTGKVVVLVE